ncbi:NAD+ diphosphatase [Rhodoglobus vestalii]|uniref:NAD(+) diphosphatase n=1 Tax=Rhodoglobus vestalii TaxID=193384 RepID=A0A8H2K5D7_9MICO|nr:NAD(+) diphosphatase [Rhodoglobus vestalii]TQO19182.1 NAD+ diphosphatase [Rhodoglobus vestalii]
MSQSFLSRLPLSRYEIDRDHLAREDPHLLDRLWRDTATRVLPIFDGSALLSAEGSLALLRPDAIERGDTSVYLGRSTSTTGPEPVGTAIVTMELHDAGHFAEASWGNLRSIATRLSARDVGLFTEALSILNWHSSHLFSPRTGEPTVVEKAGWVRRDVTSNIDVFPRTDPAIIVGVTDNDDRLLLGSNALWESNRYSLLAGFVEPGESLESAVEREIFEESGVPVVDPVYLGSQPWPFPASLMLGFMASVAPGFSGPGTPDGTEILDLRWFSRDELAASLNDIRLPGHSSIARAIIEHWYGEPIDQQS